MPPPRRRQRRQEDRTTTAAAAAVTPNTLRFELNAQVKVLLQSRRQQCPPLITLLLRLRRLPRVTTAALLLADCRHMSYQIHLQASATRVPIATELLPLSLAPSHHNQYIKRVVLTPPSSLFLRDSPHTVWPQARTLQLL